MHHYITKYWEDGVHYAVAWFQINLFNWCFCLWQRKIVIPQGKKLMIFAKIILVIMELTLLGLMIWHGFVFKIGSFIALEIYPMSRFFKKKEE